MNPNYLPFNASVDNCVKDATLRSKIIAVAIALAVSAQCPLPTCEVESPASHFNLQASAAGRQAIAAFNENIVFDVKACQEYARAFWMLRYNACFPLSRPIYSIEGSVFDSYFGVRTHVSPELVNFMNENKDPILFLASAASGIIEANIRAGNCDA